MSPALGVDTLTTGPSGQLNRTDGVGGGSVVWCGGGGWLVGWPAGCLTSWE